MARKAPETLDQWRAHHQALEAELAELERHPSVDHLEIATVKAKKLYAKDRIVALERARAPVEA